MTRVAVHLGAHRTGTTVLQKSLRVHAQALQDRDILFWGPETTRAGPLKPLMVRKSKLSKEVLVEANDSAEALGKLISGHVDAGHRVFISEENIIGSMRRNARKKQMYPDLSQSLELFRPAFQHVDVFYLTIRELGDWWTSCLAFSVQRFLSPPDARALTQIAARCTGWRPVIEAIRQAYPQATLVVREFSAHSDDVSAQVRCATGWQDFPTLPLSGKGRNPAPDIETLSQALTQRGETSGADRLGAPSGRYDPFSGKARRLFAQRYRKDLDWLSHNLSESLIFIGPEEGLDAPLYGSNAVKSKGLLDRVFGFFRS